MVRPDWKRQSRAYGVPLPVLEKPRKVAHKPAMPKSSVDALANVRQRVAAAAGSAGRMPEDVTVIAVSKTFESDSIVPVLQAGQRQFGENRVQEAKAKWPALRQRFDGIELHLIGPLQTNKAADAVKLFDCIQTLDRISLAAALRKEFDKQGRALRLLVQVNTGDETQKAGVAPDAADAFITACRETYGLSPIGLMCIPPVNEPPERHFTLLAEIAHRNGLSQLSMGMSGDFETAIRCGSTHVRVGSSIFGSR